MTENIIGSLRNHMREIAKERETGFREQLKAFGAGYGLKAITDVQHREWFEKTVAKSPPVEHSLDPKRLNPRMAGWLALLVYQGFAAVLPGKETLLGSPWLLDLGMAENGPEELKRYLRTRESFPGRMQEEGMP